MTHRIQKSKIAELGIQDFSVAVRHYIGELEAHAAQMRLVAEGKADPYPAPNVHPEIDAAVRRDGDGFVADFEIVDDSVDRAAQDLRAAKVLLLTSVSRLEQIAANSVLPEGKRRAYALKHQDVVRTRDAATRLEQVKKHADYSITTATNDEFAANIRADVAAAEAALAAVLAERGVDYTSDQIEADAAFLAEYDDLSAKMRRVERHGAELHSAIEDLPDMAAVAGWSPTPFP